MQGYARTFVGDEAIDYRLALRRHTAYENTLGACGDAAELLHVPTHEEWAGDVLAVAPA